MVLLGQGKKIVNEELYKECESITDGVYNNTYGTSAETTIADLKADLGC